MLVFSFYAFEKDIFRQNKLFQQNFQSKFIGIDLIDRNQHNMIHNYGSRYFVVLHTFILFSIHVYGCIVFVTTIKINC